MGIKNCLLSRQPHYMGSDLSKCVRKDDDDGTPRNSSLDITPKPKDRSNNVMTAVTGSGDYNPFEHTVSRPTGRDGFKTGVNEN